MHRLSRCKRGLLVLAVLSGFVLVPAAAQADPGFYESPLFGLATADGGLLVADAGQGIVNADTGVLVVSLPSVTDIAQRKHGMLWAITSAGGGPGAFLYRVEDGVATQVADLFAFEAANKSAPGQG